GGNINVDTDLDVNLFGILDVNAKENINLNIGGSLILFGSVIGTKVKIYSDIGIHLSSNSFLKAYKELRLESKGDITRDDTAILNVKDGKGKIIISAAGTVDL